MISRAEPRIATRVPDPVLAPRRRTSAPETRATPSATAGARFRRDVATLADRIVALDPARPAWARLVAISGIDASGKGVVARATAAELERGGLRVAVVGLDDWHQPPEVRFGRSEPGDHFYRHAFDFEEIFSRVIEPLRLHRNVSLSTVRPHPFTGRPRLLQLDWCDVDVVLVEGVFLFRRDLRPRYDFRVWVDCPFDTALARAVGRNQEGLATEALIADYHRIYFPAQRLHLDRDRPRETAHLIFENGGNAFPSA